MLSTGAVARVKFWVAERLHEDLADLLTDDVVLQTQPWTQRPLVGKTVALKAFRNYCRAFHCPRHFITNHQVAIDDGTATGYANWFVVQAREAQSYCGWGSYEWEFRYEDGQWKISRMLITLDCMTTLERGWGMLVDRIVPFPPREGPDGPAPTPSRQGRRRPAPTPSRQQPAAIQEAVSHLGFPREA